MEIGSEEWCAAMSLVLADVELPEVQATVEQRIGDGNGGPVVAYRLVIDGGRAHLEPTPAVVGSGDDGGVVVMSQSRSTARAVRRGELGALAALQAGLIKVSGDMRVLIVAAGALALVDAALGAALASGDGNGAANGRSAGTGDPTGDDAGDPHGDDAGDPHGDTDDTDDTGDPHGDTDDPHGGDEG